MSRALDTAEWAIHYLAHHDPTASCLKDCPICKEGTMTDADTEAGRGEGRSYDNMTSHLLAQRLEAIAMGEDRHEVDDPHVMLAAARRLRQSDPGGEPVAWRYKYDDKPGWHFRISEIDLPGPILSGRWDDVTVEALYAGEPDFADRTTTPDPPSEAEPGWQRTCLDCGEEMRVYKSDPHTCGACDSHNVVNSHPEVSASPPVEEGERGEDELTAAYRRRLGETYNFFVEKAEEVGATREGLYYTEAADAIAARLRAPQGEDGDGE